MATTKRKRAKAPDTRNWHRCVYCGRGVRTDGRTQPVTCSEHDDLPALDPLYTELAGAA